jgi:hypothetical protein
MMTMNEYTNWVIIINITIILGIIDNKNNINLKNMCILWYII